MGTKSGFLVVSLAVLCLAAPQEGKGQSPPAPKDSASRDLLNTAMLMALATNTKDLTVDLLTFAGSQTYAMVSDKTAPVEKVFWEQHAEGHKLYKMHAKEHVDKAWKIGGDVYTAADTALRPPLMQVKEMVTRLLETGSMQATAMLDVAVQKLEKQYPARKGQVPKDLPSRLLLLAYLCVVLYYSFRFGLWALKKVLSIFCCIFCCGGCGKRSSGGKKQEKKPASQPAGKAKAAGKKK